MKRVNWMKKPENITKTLMEIASKATPKQFLSNVKSLMALVEEEKDGG